MRNIWRTVSISYAKHKYILYMYESNRRIYHGFFCYAGRRALAPPFALSEARVNKINNK